MLKNRDKKHKIPRKKIENKYPSTISATIYACKNIYLRLKIS